jgi:uncharacterized protein
MNARLSTGAFPRHGLVLLAGLSWLSCSSIPETKAPAPDLKWLDRAETSLFWFGPRQASDLKKWQDRAEKGDVKAQKELALLYFDGWFVTQDYVQAFNWFAKAANQGDYVSQGYLGKMYEQGHGVPQDYATAVRWYRKAADQSSDSSRTSLGVMYEEGRGVPQDYAQALNWYRKADKFFVAQYRLGVMYEEGRGVPQDYAQALNWYRKAADWSYAAAQYRLGIAYQTGRGVAQDYVQAHMWMNLAASRVGVSDYRQYADARDALARKMTAAEIAKAQSLAREWKDELDRMIRQR